MIAYCGLDCSKCDAFIATIEDSRVKKEETAQKWSGMYRFEISPDKINCDGCKSDGAKFFHCEKCEIRQCCASQGIDHCAVCENYVCEKLAAFIQLAPEAGAELEKLRLL